MSSSSSPDLRAPGRRWLLGLAVALGCAVTPALAAAAPIPSVTAGQAPGTEALARFPGSIQYTGDNSAFLAGDGTSVTDPGNVRWTVWNDEGARGVGADWHDNCEPNCAQGHFTAYPVDVHLYRARTIAGHLTFTRMSFTYTAKRPPYSAYRSGVYVFTLDYLPQDGSQFYWN